MDIKYFDHSATTPVDEMVLENAQTIIVVINIPKFLKGFSVLLTI